MNDKSINQNNQEIDSKVGIKAVEEVKTMFDEKLKNLDEKVNLAQAKLLKITLDIK